MENKIVYQLKASVLAFFALAIFSGSCNDNQRKEEKEVNDTTSSTAANQTKPKDSTRKVTKWALLKIDAEKYKEGKEFLVVFADEKDAKKQLEKGNYNLWVEYRLPRNFNKPDRERYEIFCYGYLSYHDQNVKTDTGGHTIYFEWNKDKAANSFVKIYIAPPYKELTGDPPQVKQPPPPPMGIDY
jgi:hypothetical protein